MYYKINLTFFNLCLATPLTCDDMQLLGSGVTALSSSQIEATADAEFLDCAQTLGGYSTWDSSQLLSLLTVASRSGVSIALCPNKIVLLD